MPNVILVDDHVLLRKGLANLISNFGEYVVISEASNGKQFIDSLDPNKLPDVVLLDINMPEMDGYDTCLWLKKNHPHIRVLALSMYDNENAVIRMFKAGARGYILKDSDPGELRAALDAITTKGFYYSEMITGKLIHTINSMDEKASHLNSPVNLTDREMVFLKLVCTELTYKEIADKMFLSPRTIDGYRDDLFQKLNVKTRVGLAMYTIRNGIISL